MSVADGLRALSDSWSEVLWADLDPGRPRRAVVQTFLDAFF